jgi:integrase/recombinase XerD
MAKPPVFEDKQIEHLIKATASYSRVPERDTAVILTLYGTALAVTELATIKVNSHLKLDGSVLVASAVHPDIAHNGQARPPFWSNKRIVTEMYKYLQCRLERRQGATVKRVACRGLDPDGLIFFADDGEAIRWQNDPCPLAW